MRNANPYKYSKRLARKAKMKSVSTYTHFSDACTRLYCTDDPGSWIEVEVCYRPRMHFINIVRYNSKGENVEAIGGLSWGRRESEKSLVETLSRVAVDGPRYFELNNQTKTKRGKK